MPAARYPVEVDGYRRTHRQVIVGSRAPYGRKHGIGFIQHFRTQAPGGSERKEHRAARIEGSVYKLNALCLSAGRGVRDHNKGPFAVLPADAFKGLAEGRRDRDQRKGLPAVRVVDARRALHPVAHDAAGERLLVLHRRNHEKARRAEGFGRTRYVVKVQVRHRRGYGLTVPVPDRMMNERHVQFERR